MPEEPKLTRCIRVLDAMYTRGEMATRDVMALLDVDRQTAMRDLRSLTDAGVPMLPVGHGAQRRYRLESAYRKTRKRITVGDVLSMILGRQMVGFLGGASSTKWLEPLRERLAPAFSGPSESGIEKRLVVVDEPCRKYADDDAIVTALLEAVLEEREVAIDLDDGRAWARLHPLAVAVWRQALYVLVCEPGSGSTIRVPVERIRSARRLDSTFRYPKRFDLRAELDRAIGIEAEGQPERVVLRFDRTAAPWARRRAWHRTQELVETSDGGVVLKMTICASSAVAIVLEHAPHVVVVAPESLRTQVRDKLASALARHGELEPVA